jgi:hypothetical protein
MFMTDWSALMTPQKTTLGACVHFRDPIDVSHVSFKVLCLQLLWVELTNFFFGGGDGEGFGVLINLLKCDCD